MSTEKQWLHAQHQANEDRNRVRKAFERFLALFQGFTGWEDGEDWDELNRALVELGETLDVRVKAEPTTGLYECVHCAYRSRRPVHDVYAGPCTGCLREPRAFRRIYE